ncbi:hypothetical protein [Microtetraspora niveoalba]|uniref:hypothetical protein n=1 Tax=Microtetraspora niveoalba TaxID=46175 RepID=UPI00082E2083|nr:hypothetical protein [Microtetraspora niveoalba]
MSKKEPIPLPLREGRAPETFVPLATGFWQSVFQGGNMDKIRKWIDGANPDNVRRAGLYYSAARDLLEKYAADIKGSATELDKHCKGPVAVEMQKQLRSLHASVRELAGKMGQTGTALQSYADTLVYAQRNVVAKRFEDSRSDHDMDWADAVPFWGMKRADDRALNHLKRVNERIVQDYYQLPVDIRQDVPDPNEVPMPDFTPTNVNPVNVDPKLPGGPGGDLPGAPLMDVNGSLPRYDPTLPNLDGTNGTGLDPGDLGFGADGSGGAGGVDGTGGISPPLVGSSGGQGNGGSPTGFTGTGPGNAELAGFDGSGLSPSATTLTGPGGYGVPNVGGTGPGGAGSGSSGMVPTYGIPGGGAGGGSGASRMGGRGTGAGRMGANGMMVPPAHARGQGREEQEEIENSTGLLEDDEVWGGGDGTIPPVLG